MKGERYGCRMLFFWNLSQFTTRWTACLSMLQALSLSVGLGEKLSRVTEESCLCILVQYVEGLNGETTRYSYVFACLRTDRQSLATEASWIRQGVR